MVCFSGTSSFPDSNRCTLPDFSDSHLSALVRDLEQASFDPYLTSVGGSGMGILSPYNEPSLNSVDTSDGPVTPPETPADDGSDGDLGSQTLWGQFSEVSSEQLAQWADARGRWLFV